MAAVPDRPTVDAGLDRVADRSYLVRAVAALPPRMRAVIVLRYLEGPRTPRWRPPLGCSVGTVKSQASRALVKVRSILERERKRGNIERHLVLAVNTGDGSAAAVPALPPTAELVATRGGTVVGVEGGGLHVRVYGTRQGRYGGCPWMTRNMSITTGNKLVVCSARSTDAGTRSAAVVVDPTTGARVHLNSDAYAAGDFPGLA